MTKPETAPLYAGDFTSTTTIADVTKQHLLPEGMHVHGVHAVGEFYTAASAFVLTPHASAGEIPTLLDKVTAKSGFFRVQDASEREALFAEYQELVLRQSNSELTHDERLASWLVDPNSMLRDILLRSRKVLTSLEAKEQEDSRVRQGVQGSVYFATQDTEGQDTVTKVTWFGQYAGGFELGARPKGVKPHQWIAYKAARMIVDTPRVRIYTANHDELLGQKDLTVSGYNITTSGDVHAIQAHAAPTVRTTIGPNVSPYFKVLEATVGPEVTRQRMKTIRNIGGLLTSSDQPTAVNYMHVLPQINANSIIVGAGLGRATIPQLAHAIQTMPVEKLRDIDVATEEAEARLAVPSTAVRAR